MNITEEVQPQEIKKYIHRDISWLSFNERVLQEAADNGVPLMERVKFLAIFSSNLDEFYRVRVAALQSFKAINNKKLKAEKKPKRTLKRIRKIVTDQQNEFGRIYMNEILPAMTAEQIHLVDESTYTPTDRAFTKDYFSKHVEAHLQPHYLGLKEQKVFLENRGLYFIAPMASEVMRFGLVNIPSDVLERFVVLPAPDGVLRITFLDDILKSQLQSIFPDAINCYAIKLSRDADLSIEDEYSGNLVEKIKLGIQQRQIGAPTRFLYDSNIPEDLLVQIKQLLELKKDDLIPGGRYHNFQDFFGFPGKDDKGHLYYDKLDPLPHADFDQCTSIKDLIFQRDYLLHFPYQRFDYVPRLLDELIADEDCTDIKMTLYRTSKDSVICAKLLNALEANKNVTIFIEIKARFDEENNIYWGGKLEKAGARVIYSYPGIKVHSKIIVALFHEDSNKADIAYIGTGNFNEKTAKIYCDHALITSNEDIVSELSRVFLVLEGKLIVPRAKHLLVSPFNTRDQFEELIEFEIEQARAEKPAEIFLKMNSLEDKGLIKLLYKASGSGVKIKLIVRGICRIKAGVDGLSENIEVISIVDRYLEHARIYHFMHAGDPKMYIGSADWMERNLDRRIEVLTPIYSQQVYQELMDIMNIQWNDRRKARVLDSQLQNEYVSDIYLQEKNRAQYDIYNYLNPALAH